MAMLCLKLSIQEAHILLKNKCSHPSTFIVFIYAVFGHRYVVEELRLLCLPQYQQRKLVLTSHICTEQHSSTILALFAPQ